MGQIPTEYTNNPNESTNARIKEKVDYKKSELHVFCQKMKELVDNQTLDIERAFTLDTGPYAVSDVYLQYKENPRKWVKQSTAHWQKVLSRIHKISLLPQPSVDVTSQLTNSVTLDASSSASYSSATIQHDEVESHKNSVNGDCTKENASPLSISWKDIGLSEDVYRGIWEKAACLVADEKSIANAPGLSDAKMVASFTFPQKPHLVNIVAKGKMTCDCLNYKTRSLCSHVLAVAEKSGLLADLIEWFTSTNQGPNLWSLARSFDAPKQPGAKPVTRKRSRLAHPKAVSSSRLTESVPLHAKAVQPTISQQPNMNNSQLLLPQQEYPDFSESPQSCSSWPSYITSSSFMGPSQFSCSFTTPFSGPNQWSYNNYYPCNPFQLGSCLPFGPYHQPSGLHLPYQQIRTPMNSMDYQINSRCPQTIFEPCQESNNPFTLKFITNRISKCQGCKGSLRMSDNSLPTPPNDLIVSRMECRPFVSPDRSVKVPSKPSASHYHLNKECLTAADTNFDPRAIVLPPDVKRGLTPQHYNVLSELGFTA